MGDTPAGHAGLVPSTTLARPDLDGAAHDLLGWRVHERAGLRVEASDVPLVAGTVVVLRWGLGPLSLSIPCRVAAPCSR